MESILSQVVFKMRCFIAKNKLTELVYGTDNHVMQANMLFIVCDFNKARKVTTKVVKF